MPWPRGAVAAAQLHDRQVGELRRDQAALERTRRPRRERYCPEQPAPRCRVLAATATRGACPARAAASIRATTPGPGCAICRARRSLHQGSAWCAPPATTSYCAPVGCASPSTASSSSAVAVSSSFAASCGVAGRVMCSAGDWRRGGRAPREHGRPAGRRPSRRVCRGSAAPPVIGSYGAG